MNRISRDEYGLQVARAVAARADCTRRQVGAVVMDDEGRIVSTGYNGAPAGEPGCASAGACPRGQLTYAEHPHGQAYEEGASRCIAVHAEVNAVIYAGRDRTKGATIYVTDTPCYLCALVIKAAGIARVVTPESGQSLQAAAQRIVDVVTATPWADPAHDVEADIIAAVEEARAAVPFPVFRGGLVTSDEDARWLTPERRAAWERAREDGSEGTA
jgi:dCMP deaminase